MRLPFSFNMLQIVVLLMSLFAILPSGCSNDTPTQVRLEKKEPVKKLSEKQPRLENTLRIAVGGMITPKAGFGYYRQFLDYLGEKMGMNVEFVDRDDYAAINRLVKTGAVDAAFVCGGPYVDGHDSFGMELLAAPKAYGKTVYYSYIIVRHDSAAAGLSDLRGKKFAFTDPLSNSGALVPTYMLAKMNETPASFFGSLVYTHSHDGSIKAVAEGIVDGAAVDSLIWHYLERTNPEFTSLAKVIQKSPPYGIPPVVVPKELDPQLKERLRAVLLNAHRDDKGRAILHGMMIDRFVPINDSAYDSIRTMKVWVAQHSKKTAGK